MGRILVYVDDIDLGALFSLLLEGEGYQVAITRTVCDAQLALAAATHELVLVEAPSDLPGRGQLATWRDQLREASPLTPAILCSSVPSVNRVSAVVAGYEGYLAMPFDVEEALGELERVRHTGTLLQRNPNDSACRRP